MHAMRTGSERNIHAVVHQNLRPASTNRVDAPADQRGQLVGLEVPLPDLNQFNARARHMNDELDQAISSGGPF